MVGGRWRRARETWQRLRCGVGRLPRWSRTAKSPIPPGLLLASALILGAGCEEPATVGAQSRPAGAPRAAGSRERPNIIVILTDDQAPGTTGFEGNQHIRTPHLDRMAAEGVYCSRTYVPLPQCGPSRAAALTGRYPHDLDAMSNEDPRLPADATTIAQLLKGVGYRCGLIGKWHQGDPLTPQAGFEDYWVGRDKDAYAKQDKYYDPVIVANGQREKRVGYLTDILTDYALTFVRESEEQPFFLWLSYYAPHEPFMAHSEHVYDPADVPLPASLSDDLSTKPPQQRASVCHRWFARTDEKSLRETIAAYYSMISAVDANVGRILDMLRSSGRKEQTLVIYFSDNGWFNGEHQLVRKGPMLYEELVRAPLLFWWPGVAPAGQERPGLVSTLDLYPTLARLAGCSPGGNLPGQDLWPLVLGQRDRGHDAVYLTFLEKGPREREPMLGAVTDRFKYARYMLGGDEELYDLEADPHELNNLARAASRQEDLARNRALVDAFASTIAKPFWTGADSP